MDDKFPALYNAIEALPKDHRKHLCRVALANMAVGYDTCKQRLDQETADRAEAAKLAAHRKEKVLADALEVLPEDQRAAVANIIGIEATGTNGLVSQE